MLRVLLKFCFLPQQVSEFKRPVFDPRLGGAAQLLRLRTRLTCAKVSSFVRILARGPPRSLGKKGPCASTAVHGTSRPLQGLWFKD